MGNPEKLVILGAQDTGKILKKSKNNPETLVILGAQDTGKRLKKTQEQIQNG